MDREADIKLLDVEEVAEFLKISVSGVRRLQQHVEYLKRKRVAAIF